MLTTISNVFIFSEALSSTNTPLARQAYEMKKKQTIFACCKKKEKNFFRADTKKILLDGQGLDDRNN